MKAKRLTQATKRTPEEAARLKAIRDRYQAEKPTPDQIAGDRDLLTMGEYMEARVILHEIRKERERQNITLAELSERTGIDQGSLSKLESGKAENPTLKTLLRVLSALHIRLAVLDAAGHPRSSLAAA